MHARLSMIRRKRGTVSSIPKPLASYPPFPSYDYGMYGHEYTPPPLPHLPSHENRAGAVGISSSLTPDATAIMQEAGRERSWTPDHQVDGPGLTMTRVGRWIRLTRSATRRAGERRVDGLGDGTALYPNRYACDPSFS